MWARLAIEIAATLAKPAPSTGSGQASPAEDQSPKGDFANVSAVATAETQAARVVTREAYIRGDFSMTAHVLTLDEIEPHDPTLAAGKPANVAELQPAGLRCDKAPS